MKPEVIDKFAKSLGETAGSRFNAAKRLESHDRRLTWTTALSSAYVIIITVLPYLIKIPAEVTSNLNLYTITLSIVIIVSSLLQYSSNNLVNAEQHHRSALEINEIKRELLTRGEELDIDQFEMLRDRYNNVLQKYSVNHDNMDYYLYQIQNREKYQFISNFSAVVTYIKIVVQNHYPSLILPLITIFTFWLVFFYTYPSRIQTGT